MSENDISQNSEPIEEYTCPQEEILCLKKTSVLQVFIKFILFKHYEKQIMFNVDMWCDVLKIKFSHTTIKKNSNGVNVDYSSSIKTHDSLSYSDGVRKLTFIGLKDNLLHLVQILKDIISVALFPFRLDNNLFGHNWLSISQTKMSHVFIPNIINTDHFYARPINWFSVYNASQLQYLIQRVVNHTPQGLIYVRNQDLVYGRIYLVRDKHQNIFRARIIKTKRNLMKALLIDIGKNFSIKNAEFYDSTFEINSIPYLALKSCLDNVRKQFSALSMVPNHLVKASNQTSQLFFAQYRSITASGTHRIELFYLDSDGIHSFNDLLRSDIHKLERKKLPVGMEPKK